MKVVLLGWLSMLGFDFFLHAGLLAGLYLQPSPFLLSPKEAFARIPLGYLSFLVMAFALAWLAARLDIRGWRDGAELGLAAGIVGWGSLVLGLYSVSTADIGLLMAWWLGQSTELALAGAVMGSGLSASSLRPLAWRVSLLVMAAFVVTVLLQSVGLAPAIKR